MEVPSFSSLRDRLFGTHADPAKETALSFGIEGVTTPNPVRLALGV